MRSESGNPLVFLSSQHKSLQRSWNHKFCTIPNPLKLDRGDTDPSHECKLFLSRAKIQTPQRGVHGSQVHQIEIKSLDDGRIFNYTRCLVPGENSLRDFPSKINPLMVTHPVAGSCSSRAVHLLYRRQRPESRRNNSFEKHIVGRSARLEWLPLRIPGKNAVGLCVQVYGGLVVDIFLLKSVC